MVTVHVSWPDRDTTETLLAYPSRGDFLLDEHGDTWEITRVCWSPEPNAEVMVTVDRERHRQRP